MQTTMFWKIGLFIGLFIINGAQISAQVIANFSAAETTGCGLVQTGFTDLSTSGPQTGIINSWSWDFSMGNSNLQSPGFTFSSVGTFTVCLTVETTTGASDTECKTDYIEVYSLPVPDFEADETLGCVSHTVNFTDLTASQTAISSWIWGVGGQEGVIIDDGSLTSITNIYDNADEYSISLTVQDENGCTNSTSKPMYINVIDNPVIEVTPDNTFSCDPPLLVNFSNDNIEPNTTYQWNFGNGQSFTGATPGPIFYSAPGVYSVTVTATSDLAGCQSQLVLTDAISIGYPIAISANKQSFCLGEDIEFSDDSATPADTYNWDFGDGNSSALANPTHIYTAPGCYTVTLTRDVAGCVSSLSLPYCVEVNGLPSGSYSLDAPLGCELPHVVNFNSVIPPGSSVLWDFGDGNTSNLQNPSHSYASFGTFPVSVAITNSDGCVTTLTGETVQTEELQAQLGFNFRTGCVPLDFILDESSTSLTPIVSWNWEILDPASVPPIIFSSTSENPFVTIPDTGVYDVRLTVTNTLGCSSTRTFQERISAGESPLTDFTVAPDSACRMEDVFFTDNSTSFADEWFWDFGDTNISEEENPAHTYSSIGPFTVTLISSHNGCRDTLIQPDVIEVLPPRAAFEVAVVCSNPNNREFTNISSGSEIVHWDFGVSGTNSDTSNLETPQFLYPNPGTYLTTLITQNETTGCSDTTQQEIIVTNLTPAVEIQDSVGCAPFVLDINNTSIDAQTYSWIAPGGTIVDSTLEFPTITFENGGTYTGVELMVEDVNGCQEILTLNTPIEVNELEAALMPSTIAGCAGQQVDFTNTSSATYNNVIASTWMIGPDLDTFYTQDASFTFDAAGDYPIVLTVEDDGGCVTTVTHPDLINITDPQAAYSSEAYACTFSPLQLTSTSQGEGLGFVWDFGDGNNSIQEDPMHQFSTEGQYDVCLTVTDKNSCVSTTCETEQIIVADPVAAFSVDNAYGACPPMLANFVNNSNNAINYEWDFGDDSGASDLNNPPHVYTEPGTFDVSLIAYTSSVCADTLNLADYIVLEGPVGDFSYEVDNTCSPAMVTFSGASMDPYDYYWDYGDGNIDTTYSVDNDTLEYTYNDIGNFNPKLILVDNQNCQRILEGPSNIEVGGFNYEFQAGDSLFCGNQGLTTLFFFEGETSHPLQEVNWSFPGSNTPTSTTATPLVSYNTPGTYDVQLIVDNGFCRDTLNKPNYINVGAIPDASLAVDNQQGCFPLSANFTDMSTVVGGTVVEWNWDFGDGNSSSQQNPSNQFMDVGINTVSLEVKSDIGCTQTNEIDVEVFALPEAEIAGETNICEGELALLQGNILSGAAGGSVVWNGGPVDCASCIETEASPTVTTTYELTVVDGNSCSTTESFEVYVRDAVAANIDLGADTSACMDVGVELMLQVDQSLVNINWSTDQEGLSCYENCPNPLANPTETTTYSVTVVNVDGCVSEDEIVVAIIDDSREFVNEDLTICEGDSAILSVNYGTDAVWSSEAIIPCTNCPEVYVAPTEESEYFVEVTSENGCLIKDSVIVSVQTRMEVEAGLDTVACVDAGVILEGVGEGSASWFPLQSVADPDEHTTLVTPDVSTMYYFQVDDGICRNDDSVFVEVIYQAEVFVEGEEICQGDTVSLSGNGIAQDYFWYSDIEDLIGTGSELEYIPSRTSGYSLIGTLPGCAPDTAFFNVSVYDNPLVDYPETVSVLPEMSVQIVPNIGDSEGLTFTWSPADELSCGSCVEPFASGTETKTFSVEILNPETGCVTNDEVELRILTKCNPNLITIPNVFSPNNDGRNDEVFMLSSSIQQIKNFRVFDRWGSTVFTTTNMQQGWNGTLNGKKLPAGVYVYLLEAECPIDGSTFYKKGDITIMR